jgi:predicted dehydrogenase
MHLEAIRFFCGKTDLLLVEKPLGLTHRESLEIVRVLSESGQRAMCGLIGLYHPEFQAMYQQLDRVGPLIRVSERLHEAGAHLRQYVSKSVGVLTENGVHTLHRFFRIARQKIPDGRLRIAHCDLATREFVDAAGEDLATGQLCAKGGAVFNFDIAFHNTSVCGNGLPIQYEMVVEGDRGVVRVTGWEKCESCIDGNLTVHYEHPDGPLNGRSQYPRIHQGMQNQMDACLRFHDGTEQLHFTIDEALRTQELIEACYESARTRPE